MARRIDDTLTEEAERRILAALKRGPLSFKILKTHVRILDGFEGDGAFGSLLAAMKAKRLIYSTLAKGGSTFDRMYHLGAPE